MKHFFNRITYKRWELWSILSSGQQQKCQIVKVEEVYLSSNSLKRADFNSSSFSSAFTPAFCLSVSWIAASSLLSSSSILNSMPRRIKFTIIMLYRWYINLNSFIIQKHLSIISISLTTESMTSIIWCWYLTLMSTFEFEKIDININKKNPSLDLLIYMYKNFHWGKTAISHKFYFERHQIKLDKAFGRFGH